MEFDWIQFRTSSKQMQHWGLRNTETGIIVFQIWLSRYGSMKRNFNIRRKVRIAYEVYYKLVWMEQLKFF